MPLYEYRCSCGEHLEVLASPSSPAPPCPRCDAPTRKVVAGFALGGRASPGRSQAEMPQTWKGTYGADREYVRGLQHEWDRRQRLEERHPELAGDRRPVVAHEGRYAAEPLRAGGHQHPHPTRTPEGPPPARAQPPQAVSRQRSSSRRPDASRQ